MLIARGRIPGWHLLASVSLRQNKITKVAATSVYVPQVSHTCTLPFWEALHVSKWIHSSEITASALSPRASKTLCISFKSNYLLQLSGSNKSDRHWPSKPKVLELSFWYRTPWLRSSIQGLDPSLGYILCNYFFCHFWVTHQSMWILTLLCLHPSMHLILVSSLYFQLQIFSADLQVILTDCSSLHSYKFGVLWEDVNSEFFCFTIFEQYILYQFYPHGYYHSSSHHSSCIVLKKE